MAKSKIIEDEMEIVGVRISGSDSQTSEPRKL